MRSHAERGNERDIKHGNEREYRRIKQTFIVSHLFPPDEFVVNACKPVEPFGIVF